MTNINSLLEEQQELENALHHISRESNKDRYIKLIEQKNAIDKQIDLHRFNERCVCEFTMDGAPND